MYGIRRRVCRWVILLPLTLNAVVVSAAEPCYDCEPSGPKKYSDEWWDMRAGDPAGTRQVYKHGKLWPPYPRPTGPEQTFVHKYHHAHYWPYPYVCEDRQSVRQAFAAQAENGWTDATTLYDFHFDPEKHELTRSGRLQLQWILTTVPHERRMVYIAKTYGGAYDEARLQNVAAATAEVLGPGERPPIMLRYANPVGRPAEEIVVIRRAELESLPAPRIDFTTSGSAGQ